MASNVVQMRRPPESIDTEAARHAMAFAAKLEAALARPGHAPEDAARVAACIFAVMGAEFASLMRRNGVDRDALADLAGDVANAFDGGLLAGMEAGR